MPDYRPEFITVKMDDGSELLVQAVHVPNNDGGKVLAGSSKNAVRNVKDLFDKTMPQLTSFAKTAKDSFIGKIKEIDEAAAPDEFELEFSVGFSAEAKAVIASSEMSMGMILHMKWNLNK